MTEKRDPGDVVIEDIGNGEAGSGGARNDGPTNGGVAARTTRAAATAAPDDINARRVEGTGISTIPS
ncbi:hypothetical protein [Novosphingobium sp. Rr 2-17]|uniref:hypothetical protein n=1 Tax=Novosphingobium sp. Rr 2-17 TaxID=555793 RepID=UPI0003112AAF|nr:hypothetical protein [Novosphingobium sp. Rr 2-17]